MPFENQIIKFHVFAVLYGFVVYFILFYNLKKNTSFIIVMLL